jgi:hypothetical protein
MVGGRRLAFAVCALGLAVLAGCSSSPNAGQQAHTERAAVLPAAKHLYQQVVDAGTGWTATIMGSYWPCGTNDPLATGQGTDMVQYTAEELISPFNVRIAFASFSRQVVQTLDGAGWDLRSRSGPSDLAHYYAGRHGGFDLWLILLVNQQTPPQSVLRDTATIDISGSCFNAGSTATSLTARGPADQISEPRPTATPTPRNS